MHSIIVFHPFLFDKVTGSAEKLLREFILVLADSGHFLVHAVFGDRNTVEVPEELIGHANVRLCRFAYDRIENAPPWRFVGMTPNIVDMVASIKARAFICLVSDEDQEPVRSLPLWLPVMLIAPFGNFCSNGNVRKLYVSGVKNVARLKRRGVWAASVFYNPLVVPPVNVKKASNVPINRPILIGRVGRSDSSIFDPISILAFARLEAEYAAAVRYVYVNPPKEARALVSRLGLKQVEFREWLSEKELAAFYDEIDVFAHARKDGETLGVAIAEAMLRQNVIVTHVSRYFNEHLFLAREPFGRIAGIDDADGYYAHLKYFVSHPELLPSLGRQAREFAATYFDGKAVGRRIVSDCIEACSFYGKPTPALIRLWYELLRGWFWVKLYSRKVAKYLLLRIDPALDLAEARRFRWKRLGKVE